MVFHIIHNNVASHGTNDVCIAQHLAAYGLVRIGCLLKIIEDNIVWAVIGLINFLQNYSTLTL